MKVFRKKNRPFVKTDPTMSKLHFYMLFKVPHVDNSLQR